ncbi:MAG: FecR domain-containing protein, partial [Dokdonia sp.]
LGYSYLNGDGLSTYATDLAENQVIGLPDNSAVTLNESSELSFSEDSWEEERRINLLGEAYFEVEKGNPFRVVTTQGVVEVLGTSFNVKARDSLFTVVCYEGLVRVDIEDTQILLPAGQSLNWQFGEAIKQSIFVQEPSWLNNRTVFKAAPLKAVIIALEQQYKVRIEYPKNTDLSFTGAFEHDDLKNALEMVFSPLNLTYTIDNNTSVTVRYEQ